MGLYKEGKYFKITSVKPITKLSNMFLNELIYERLEGQGGTYQAREHNCIHIASKVCNKHSLPFVLFPDSSSDMHYSGYTLCGIVGSSKLVQ